MEKHHALLDEVTYIKTLKCGLKVAIHPKPNYQKAYVSLQVNFGGLDIDYFVNDQAFSIPEGVAHYLEHMVFSNNGRNLAEEFAKKGARINAYTSKSVTAYSFDTRHHYPYLLDYFLSSFLIPDFKDSDIEKERKIIKHELLMSEDSIHTKVYQKLKSMMYSDNAIITDVGGTVAEVMKINKATLNQVFNQFYHPKNMTLIISGKVAVDHTLELLNNHEFNQHNWLDFNPIKRKIDDQVKTDHQYLTKTSETEENIINIGVKIPQEIFKNYSKEYINIGMNALINNMFGLGSKNYDYLDKMNLMNVSFSAKPSIERDFGFVTIYIQTPKHKLYLREMLKILESISTNDLDEELFEIDKKAILGNYIRLFDSLPRTHEFVCNCLLEDVNIDTYLSNLMKLTPKDLEPLKQIFKKENIYSIIYLK